MSDEWLNCLFRIFQGIHFFLISILITDIVQRDLSLSLKDECTQWSSVEIRVRQDLSGRAESCRINNSEQTALFLNTDRVATIMNSQDDHSARTQWDFFFLYKGISKPPFKWKTFFLGYLVFYWLAWLEMYHFYWFFKKNVQFHGFSCFQLHWFLLWFYYYFSSAHLRLKFLLFL